MTVVAAIYNKETPHRVGSQTVFDVKVTFTASHRCNNLAKAAFAEPILKAAGLHPDTRLSRVFALAILQGSGAASTNDFPNQMGFVWSEASQAPVLSQSEIDNSAASAYTLAGQVLDNCTFYLRCETVGVSGRVS